MSSKLSELVQYLLDGRDGDKSKDCKCKLEYISVKYK